ncbi:MAG: chromate transporter [Bacillota bacterium]|nr:chromate transporter [Bacillota bacterium]
MIAQLFFSFLKLGLFSFGGGYAMIPLLERELVKSRGWLSPRQFVDAVALSQMTPGPIAINAATLVGFRQAGVWGSLAATIAVILPPVVIVWGLALFVRRQAGSAWLKAAFAGLRPMVVALVTVAALSLARESVPDLRSAALLLATAAAVGHWRLHPVLAILGAGFLGIMFFRG